MMSKITISLKDIFTINTNKEPNEVIIQKIKDNARFKGASLWILLFAVLIASIGLNINSIPIIIGAMLISPLMGPLLGLGMSLGINDSQFLRKSLKHLFIATVMGIAISALYFYISPIRNVQSELLARISPTIYDVLIAFFGGLAGIIGSTRLEKGTVIPGVAIATALLPPLCTVGYGLATSQPQFFFGALYLYLINCIFICLATLIGVKYLRLPSVHYLDKKNSRRTKNIIAVVVVIMIVPAVYFAYLFVKENNFNQNVSAFIEDKFLSKNYAMIYKDVEYNTTVRSIEVAFLSKHFTQAEIADLQSQLIQYNLPNTTLVIKQDNASLTEIEWDEAIANIKNDSERVKAIEAKLASGFIGDDTTLQVLIEAQAINPKITKVALGNLFAASTPASEDSPETTPENTVLTVLFYTDPAVEKLSEEEQVLLTNWIKTRMQNQELLTYFM